MKATELGNTTFSQLNHLRDIVDPPYLRIARELAQQQKYLDLWRTPLQDLARDYAKINELAKVANPVSLSITRQLKQFDSVTRMNKIVAESSLLNLSKQLTGSSLLNLSKELAGSSLLNLSKQLTESPLYNLSRQLQSQQDSFTNMYKMVLESPALTFVRELQEHQKLNVSAFQKAWSATADFQKLFGQTFVTSSLALQANSASLLAAIEDDFFDTPEESEANYEQTVRELQVKLHAVVRYIVECLLAFAKKHKPSISDMVNITLAVLMWLDSNVADEKTRALFKEEIAKSEKRIISTLANSTCEVSSRDTYVVVRFASIRVKPSHKSAKIASVYTNQTVTILLRQKEWVYVQYNDYIEGIPKTGWIAKKYLTKAKVRS